MRRPGAGVYSSGMTRNASNQRVSSAGRPTDSSWQRCNHCATECHVLSPYRNRANFVRLSSSQVRKPGRQWSCRPPCACWPCAPPGRRPPKESLATRPHGQADSGLAVKQPRLVTGARAGRSRSDSWPGTVGGRARLLCFRRAKGYQTSTDRWWRKSTRSYGIWVEKGGGKSYNGCRERSAWLGLPGGEVKGMPQEAAVAKRLVRTPAIPLARTSFCSRQSWYSISNTSSVFVVPGESRYADLDRHPPSVLGPS